MLSTHDGKLFLLFDFLASSYTMDRAVVQIVTFLIFIDDPASRRRRSLHLLTAGIPSQGFIYWQQHLK